MEQNYHDSLGVKLNLLKSLVESRVQALLSQNRSDDKPIYFPKLDVVLDDKNTIRGWSRLWSWITIRKPQR